MNSGNDTGKILGAVVLGVVAGAVLGILFAPDKGSETRKKLFDKAKDLSDQMKKRFNESTSNPDNEAEEGHETKGAGQQASNFGTSGKRSANGHATKEKRNQEY